MIFGGNCVREDIPGTLLCGDEDGGECGTLEVLAGTVLVIKIWQGLC